MNRNLSVQQILRQKNIPNDIEYEIVQYLPLPEQVRIKKKMMKRLNYWYQEYWEPIHSQWVHKLLFSGPTATKVLEAIKEMEEIEGV